MWNAHKWNNNSTEKSEPNKPTYLTTKQTNQIYNQSKSTKSTYLNLIQIYQN